MLATAIAATIDLSSYRLSHSSSFYYGIIALVMFRFLVRKFLESTGAFES